MDATGGVLNAYTTKEATAYYARVLDQHMPVALDLLADMLLNSTFAEEELAREKEVVLEEIGMAEDTPEDLVHEVFDAHVFAGHPLARPVLGTREAVKQHRREDVIRFVRGRYVPPPRRGRRGQRRPSAAGGRNRTVVRRPGGTRASGETDAAFVVRAARLAVEKDTEQVHVCVGGPGLRRADPRRFGLDLLDIILGGGMSSRLFQQLRENRGLVYSTYSYTASYTETGVFGVYAATRPGRVDQVLDIILRELGQLAGGRIEEAEVDRAREQAKGSLMLALESTAARVGRLAGAELWNEPYLSPPELMDRLDRVTAADVRSLAEELLSPEGLSVVMLGPVSSRRQAGHALEAIG